MFRCDTRAFVRTRTERKTRINRAAAAATTDSGWHRAHSASASGTTVDHPKRETTRAQTRAGNLTTPPKPPRTRTTTTTAASLCCVAFVRSFVRWFGSVRPFSRVPAVLHIGRLLRRMDQQTTQPRNWRIAQRKHLPRPASAVSCACGVCVCEAHTRSAVVVSPINHRRL